MCGREREIKRGKEGGGSPKEKERGEGRGRCAFVWGTVLPFILYYFFKNRVTYIHHLSQLESHDSVSILGYYLCKEREREREREGGGGWREIERERERERVSLSLQYKTTRKWLISNMVLCIVSVSMAL